MPGGDGVKGIHDAVQAGSVIRILGPVNGGQRIPSGFEA